jgi:hypothetical protein
MPTGWLVTVSYNGWDRYVKTARVYDSDPGPPTCVDTKVPADAGTEPVFWRRIGPSPPGASYDEYVCYWTQFSAVGDLPPEQGWFHGMPWLTSRPGEVRDTYLKLDTIDYGELLERHAPVLAFDWDENFYPQDPGAFAEFAEIPPTGYEASNEWVNGLYDAGGQMLAAAGSSGSPPFPSPLTLGALGSTYTFGGGSVNANVGDYLDARGSSEPEYVADALSQRGQGYEDVVYGRIVHDPVDGRLWLQYWVFYYFNSFGFLGVGVHEGDWEMVQVALSPAGVPQEMTFGAHNHGFKVGWSGALKGGLDGQQPIVHVAARSHASYPYSGESALPEFGLASDQHWGDGVWMAPPMQEITSDTRWTGWPGRWGASLSGLAPSPPNPSQQGKWDAPSAFHAAATQW